jgi:hypothetical protein
VGYGTATSTWGKAQNSQELCFTTTPPYPGELMLSEYHYFWLEVEKLVPPSSNVSLTKSTSTSKYLASAGATPQRFVLSYSKLLK